MAADRVPSGYKFRGDGASWMEAAVAWYEQVESAFIRGGRRPRRDGLGREIDVLALEPVAVTYPNQTRR